jgi:hypothetical protein
MSVREHVVKVRFNADELAQLDESRPDGLTRAQWLRELARGRSAVGETPSRDQVVAALWQMTKDGKVQAAVALERALRPHTGLRNEPLDVDGDWLEEFLNR